MKKVLIVDDHVVVRKGLRHIIADMEDLVVAAEAGNAWEAENDVDRNHYDVVILDISLPGKNGFEVLKELRRKHPRLPVVILSMYPEEQYGARAFSAGASGYLTKQRASEERTEALETVLKGEKYISPSVGRQSVRVCLLVSGASVNWTAYFGAKLPPISGQSCHLFRRIAATFGPFSEITETMTSSGFLTNKPGGSRAGGTMAVPHANTGVVRASSPETMRTASRGWQAGLAAVSVSLAPHLRQNVLSSGLSVRHFGQVMAATSEAGGGWSYRKSMDHAGAGDQAVDVGESDNPIALGQRLPYYADAGKGSHLGESWYAAGLQRPLLNASYSPHEFDCLRREGGPLHLLRHHQGS